MDLVHRKVAVSEQMTLGSLGQHPIRVSTAVDSLSLILSSPEMSTK